MLGIANLTTEEFYDRVNSFSQRYINDWQEWLATDDNDRSQQLGVILRKWQACRPNRMRRTIIEKAHPAPYIEDLIYSSTQYIKTLSKFELQDEISFSPQSYEALDSCWDIFKNLSYYGNVRNGLTGIVGISKCVLLLTDGRVGPAFDAKVKGNLGIRKISNSKEWIDALQLVSRDIRTFERKNGCTIKQAVPQQYSMLHVGRIYDMALGPN